MLTVMCFVFRGKARSGSDEDADCSVMCSRECQNVRNSFNNNNNNDIWRVINVHYYYY